jgi:hypothetical protein
VRERERERDAEQTIRADEPQTKWGECWNGKGKEKRGRDKGEIETDQAEKAGRRRTANKKEQ